MRQGSRPIKFRNALLRVTLFACASLGLPMAIGQAQAQQPATPLPDATTSPTTYPYTDAPTTTPYSDAPPAPTEALPVPPPTAWTPPASWTSRTNNADLPELPALPVRRPPRQHIFLIPGYLLSMTPAIASRSSTYNGRTTTTDIATGHGAELSLSIWPPGGFTSYGGFVQAQRYFSFNGNHSRYAIGGQVSWTMLGVELGVAHRGADDLRIGTTMAQIGPYLSLAWMTICSRISIPLHGGSDAKPAHGAEVSFVMGFKLPLHLK